jgi:hypothetical protein
VIGRIPAAPEPVAPSGYLVDVGAVVPATCRPELGQRAVCRTEVAAGAVRCFHVRMKMNAAERMALMRFVCSFVWTDLRVAQKERDLVMRISGRLGLTEAEVGQVDGWLQAPPSVDDLDPSAIPKAHRQLFVQAAELAIKADGQVVPVEAEALALFRELLSD